MRENAYYGNLMLLLRNKDQRQKNPLPCSAWQWNRQLNCKLTHYCMTPGPCTNLALAQCESVLPENKLLLQELHQVIEIELLTSCFLENVGS